MASFYSTQSIAITDPRAFEPLPKALRYTCPGMKMLCFLALGHPYLDDHWKSLQLEQAFETVRNRLCSTLTGTTAAASVLLATSGVFVSTASPVWYFDYTSPVPYSLLFISLVFAMIAMFMSGWSRICWLRADRHWTQKRLKQGSYFPLYYLLSIAMPTVLIVFSFNCFMFATLIAGFSSRSMICRAVTALPLVAYVVIFGTILMEVLWEYATSLNRSQSGLGLIGQV